MKKHTTIFWLGLVVWYLTTRQIDNFLGNNEVLLPLAYMASGGFFVWWGIRFRELKKKTSTADKK
jgi:hypothetical protein